MSEINHEQSVTVHETIKDIIAEKRRRTDEIERDVAEKMERGEAISDRYARELVADMRREADRLEAAWDRQSAQWVRLARNAMQALADAGEPPSLGNCAVMRDTLLAIREAHAKRETPHDILVLHVIDDALAARPRACDVLPEEDLVKTITRATLLSLQGKNIIGEQELVKAVVKAAIACAYDTKIAYEPAAKGAASAASSTNPSVAPATEKEGGSNGNE